MEKLLELENVSYSYQDGKEKNQILDHASYLFEKGKIYAVVGASGSGKTTTLSLASGLDKLMMEKFCSKEKIFKK